MSCGVRRSRRTPAPGCSSTGASRRRWPRPTSKRHVRSISVARSRRRPPSACSGRISRSRPIWSTARSPSAEGTSMAAVEIKVPTLGESVTEATVAKWFKHEGDAVAVDEALCELETDKVTVEVNATAAGAIGKIVAAEGETVQVGAVLCVIEAGAAGAAAKPAAAPAAAKPAATPAPAPAAPAAAPTNLASSGPAARKLVAESGIDPSAIAATGKDGRITKADVLTVLA